MFYLGLGGEAVRCASTEQSKGSGGILPQKSLNFTLPVVQSNGSCYFEHFGQILRVQMQMKSNKLGYCKHKSNTNRGKA